MKLQRLLRDHRYPHQLVHGGARMLLRGIGRIGHANQEKQVRHRLKRVVDLVCD